MSDETPNLFDLSRGSPEKKHVRSRPPEKTLPHSSDEIFEMLNKMKEKHNKLALELEETFRKTGIEPSELTKYCENPDNFTKMQWERYKTAKEAVERNITGMSREELAKSHEAKQKSRGAKERRGKTLGSRKNWLNMH